MTAAPPRAAPPRAALSRAALSTIALLLSGCFAPAQGDAGPMVLGVATHFDQGWSRKLLADVGASRITSIRDDLPWGKGEPVPGQYVFNDGNSGYVRAACDRGIDVLLMVEPRNEGYDNGQSAHSDRAQQAYARYLTKLLDHFGTTCVIAIEIGNELNGGGLRLPAGIDPAKTYARLLATIVRIVKPAHPEVKILGGSTNSIGTGYLEALFEAGALASSDGIVVHPYRDHPETVDFELRRLAAIMRRHGTPKPIWATEFGDEVDDPRLSAGILLRMLCLLGAAGVERAYWYALVDEPAYRNMGLYTADHALKPAGEAARAAGRLLAGGARPSRVDVGDRGTFLYRIAPERYVMWGNRREISVRGDGRAFDARGRAIAMPRWVGSEPVILTGVTGYRFGPVKVYADSLYEFGDASWSYFARRRAGQLVPLALIDWDWTSFYGAPGLRPLELGAVTAIAAGDGGNPLSPTIRYTVPAALEAAIALCLTKKAAGDGMDIHIYHNGDAIWSGILIDRLHSVRPNIRLAKGDTLDFAFGPNRRAGDDALSYRIRISDPGVSKASLCG
jgi:hypothetical protein